VTRRRRAAVLLGLALLLGTLAASHMARREAALAARIGPLTEIVVARRDLAAGHTLQLDDLAVRELPARYAPQEPAFAATLAGHELAVPVRAGAPVTPNLLAPAPQAPAIERGQRAIDVLATGSAEAAAPGTRVDVLVTTEHRTRVALENVEVLAAARAPPSEDTAPRITATLRVTAAQAVYLAAAQTFAREVRLLARAPGDRRTVGPLTVEDGL